MKFRNGSHHRATMAALAFALAMGGALLLDLTELMWVGSILMVSAFVSLIETASA